MTEVYSRCEHCGSSLRYGETFDGYIYFLHSPEMSKIKIGYSKYPASRIKDIRKVIPLHINSLRIMRGSMSHEKRLFKLWERYREQGEWFKASDELLAWIDSLLDGERITFQDIETLRKDLLAKMKVSG